MANPTVTRVRRVIAATAAVTLVSSLFVLGASSPASAAPGFDLVRLQGPDRYGTAATIATETFPGGATEAIIARGDAFPDALSGTYLAGAVDAPILLAARNDVPAVTMDALDELGTTSIRLLGGVSALGTGVEAELRNAGYTVNRIGGADRYFTASRVASTPGRDNVGTNGDGQRTAILATGESFPDAMAGGPLSAHASYPVLLTTLNTVPEITATTIDTLGIDHLIVLGGPAAISAAQENRLNNDGIETTRLAGANRGETAVAIAEYAIDEEGFDPSHVNVATGSNFPDALAGGPHGGVEQAPILLETGNTDRSATCDFLTDQAALLRSAHVFGGVNAVSQSAERTLEICGGADGTPAPGVPSLTITPATAASLRADGLVAEASSQDDRIYTASSLDNTKRYRVTIVDAGNITIGANGVVTIADLNNDDIADPNGATPVSARIVALQGGALQPPAQTVGNIAPANGTISFTVDGAEAESVIPVIYEDPGTGPSTFLDLNSVNQPVDRFGLGGRIDYTVTSNATITVNPAVAATIVANDTGGEANTPADDRSYSAVGLNQALRYSVTLLLEDHLTSSGGLVRFRDFDNDGRADTTPGPSAQIISVNGANVTPAQTSTGIAPVGGQIDFTIDGDNPENVVPVVYADPGNGGTSALDLDSQDRPVDAFGIGGRTVFVPQTATTGNITEDETVTFVGATGDRRFFTQTAAGVNKGYVYDSTDLFYIVATPTASNEPNTAQVEDQVTIEEFEEQLSRGDQLSAGSTYASTTGFSSSFILEDLGPGPVTATVTATRPDSVTLTVNGVVPGAQVAVYAGPDDNDTFDSAEDRLQTTSTVDNDPIASGWQTEVQGLQSAANYDLFVTQVLDGDESAPSARLDARTGDPQSLAIRSIRGGASGSTEVVLVEFTAPVASCQNDRILVTRSTDGGVSFTGPIYDGDDALLTFSRCVLNVDGNPNLVAYDLDGDTLTLNVIDDPVLDPLVRLLDPLSAILDPLVGDGDRLEASAPPATYQVTIQPGGAGNVNPLVGFFQY